MVPFFRMLKTLRRLKLEAAKRFLNCCYFRSGDYYFWVPLLCCHVGGILGSWVYKIFIEIHWPEVSYDFTGSPGNQNDLKLDRMS